LNLAELKQSGESDQLNPFYISFSDLMVLLCVFFVMILGMSKIDTGSFEKIKTGFTGVTKGTLVELHSRLEQIAKMQSGVTVEMADDGVRLDLDTAVLFATGSAVLNSKQLTHLAPLLIEVLKTNYMIDIEGHTDDVPFYRLKGKMKETNWSLSGQRSSSVVHHLKDFGFPDKRLRIVGYGSTMPKISVKGKKGKILSSARSKNRRVSLLIK